MIIGELFVRLRGDNSDLDRKLAQAERGLGRVDGASKRLNSTMGQAHLQTGRLGNQFAGLAGQLTGLHPIVGNVAGVMGNFAIGAGLTVGVLAGLAAIALAWDKLTESTRNADKAQDEALKRLAKARELKALGPGGQTLADVHQARGELVNLLRRGDELQRELDANKGVLGLEEMTLGRIAENQEKIRNAQALIASGQKTVADAVTATLPPVVKLKDGFNEGRDAAEEYQLQQQIAALKLRMVLDELQKIADLHAEIADQAKFTGMPNISMPFEGLDKNEKKQLQELGILTDTTEESGNKIRDAIWGSATQMANQIVSALNVGGGGKGSNLGGALGGTAGFAAGFLLGGPIGGAIGSTIGNIAGSLFGGLFDSNSKALNANTEATRANTQAMLLFQPAGFKSESYRYNASDPRSLDALGRNVRWNASRGGANPLLGT